MAAMKPRTGDGPLEVTKEGRGLVMRVPLEGGGRLVVELSADEATVLPVSAAQSATQYVHIEQPDAAAGAVHTLPLPGELPSTVLIVGLGDGSARDLRVAAVALGRRFAEEDE